jgi:DNA-nicking Smr family endonuclease
VDSFGHVVDEHGGRVWPDAYYAARKEAEEHAAERGNCFDASKKAFEEDRKAEAKELSDKGKKHGVQMEEANKRAAAVILGPQNLDQAGKIDLHGLLLKEAVEATRDFVKGSIGKKSTVEVITGQGIHSDKAKGPVIKPAIIDMCKEENWQIDSDPNNPGSFTVHVPSA